jgi:hypothetical protein
MRGTAGVFEGRPSGTSTRKAIMKKVKLALNDLHVESFAVESQRAGAGTVEGLENEESSRVHTDCYSHCPSPSPCEPCGSQLPTHCNGDTPCVSWDGACATAPSGCPDTCQYTMCPDTCDPYGCGTTP